MADYAFGELGLNRICIRAEPANTPSRSIPIRLGFTYEDTLRQLGRFRDRYYDHEVYSLLRSEWEEKQAVSR